MVTLKTDLNRDIEEEKINRDQDKYKRAQPQKYKRSIGIMDRQCTFYCVNVCLKKKHASHAHGAKSVMNVDD